MLYYFLKIVVGISTRIFYCSPLILNRAHVPQDEPLIIASNHPNALCDPCSIAVFAKQQIHFLARGDVFQNKILYWIFVKQLGMVPIYRLSEGAENLHKNEETFRISTENLKQKKTILMFSEGICVQERRLRKLKKGTARIAFASEESTGWNLGLKIIPVGLNYTDPKKFRSTLVINYGKSFEVSMFKESYLKDKAIAINEFTKYLEERLAEMVVHITDPRNDLLVAQTEEILQNESENEKGKEYKFRLTERIVKDVNDFSDKQPSEFFALCEKAKKYFSILEQCKIKDNTVKKITASESSISNLISYILLLLVGFPFHFFGLINNYLPYKAGYKMAKRIVKQTEFHASVHMYSSMTLYLIFYPLQILAVALIFRNWWVLGAYLILLPLSGLFSLKYYTFLKKTFWQWRFFFLKNNKREEIISIRNEIVNEIKLTLKLET